jgi:hypothetical protein
MKSKKEWFVFCFGKAKSSENKGQKPLLSILYQMNQSNVVSLFDHFVEWIEEKGFSHDLVDLMSSTFHKLIEFIVCF